ncbi:protein ALP1-like [Anneissia japonica]|uniref:protein ALP1-like n=1 Tax=Anneissia japonica TaxID=1529436 RepID=UPI0014255C59|nr:protein ALP1-like [Anneissia japonica]
MALVDADSRFLYVDIGAKGRCSDGGVFQDCTLRDALEKGKLGLPEPAPLPNDDQPVPYSIVADDAFPMRSWLMKPYPHRQMTRQQRIFNYRLSRARRVVENAFGILAHR